VNVRSAADRTSVLPSSVRCGYDDCDVRSSPVLTVDVNAFAEERLESLLGPALAIEAMATSLRALDLSRLETPAQLRALGQLLMDQDADRDDGRSVVGALLVLHAARFSAQMHTRPSRRSAAA